MNDGNTRDTRIDRIVSPRSHIVGSSRIPKILLQCTMGIREICILISRPLFGRTRLKALGISRYHLNAQSRHERGASYSYNLSAAASDRKHSGIGGITSMYDGDTSMPALHLFIPPRLSRLIVLIQGPCEQLSSA